MWTRRAFIRSAGASFAAGLLPARAEALAAAELVFASSVQRRDGGYGAVLVTELGKLVASVDLPDRGHDITVSPVTGEAVVFARQPGTFAVVFDPRRDRAPVTLTSSDGRHFFGHGAFSRDGRLLYATENAFDDARSVVGVYDATGGYRRIAEFETHGIGAHEVLLSGDGAVLVVANGGIETHPDYGRTELNLATMDPSLVFLDAATGALIGQLRLAADLHQLSIRHLAFDARGRVWFGCQFRGPSEQQPQLVGYATRDGDIRLIRLPETDLRDLRNYVGSVAASADGTVIGVSSPEGNTILAIDAATATPTARLALDDGCGIAGDGQGLVASSGEGVLAGFAGSPAPERKVDLLFDNHLRRIS